MLNKRMVVGIAVSVVISMFSSVALADCSSSISAYDTATFGLSNASNFKDVCTTGGDITSCHFVVAKGQTATIKINSAVFAQSAVARTINIKCNGDVTRQTNRIDVSYGATAASNGKTPMHIKCYGSNWSVSHAGDESDVCDASGWTID